MFSKVRSYRCFIKQLRVFVFFLLLSSFKVFPSVLEEDIYKDPDILKIFVQDSALRTLNPELTEAVRDFSQVSAKKQLKILEDFCLVQDRLEREYRNIKASLTNRRLAKYGATCIVALTTPFFSIKALNAFLSEDSQIEVSALPFTVFQGSVFFMFKFLELFSKSYIASNDGVLQDYEIWYVRNKPLFEKDFCKVFEDKLIAAHKNPSNIYDYLKWLNSSTALPISKELVSIDLINHNFEEKFSIFPSHIKKKSKDLCLRHIIQQHTRVIAYFHGPSGTGKTKCVREIACCLGLPLGVIALSNYNVSDLVGQGGSHLPNPGKFAEAILNAKNKKGKTCTNMVLLIDEADKILNAEESNENNNGLLPFLLNFLDPDTESYYNPYFEKNIRIKDILIILAGNKPLKNGNYSALLRKEKIG